MRYHQIMIEGGGPKIPNPVAVPAFAKTVIIKMMQQPEKYEEDASFCVQGYMRATGKKIRLGHDPNWDAILEKIDFDTWIENHRSQFYQGIERLFGEAASRLETWIHGNVVRIYRWMRLRYDPVQAISAGKRDLGLSWAHTDFFQTERDVGGIDIDQGESYQTYRDTSDAKRTTFTERRPFVFTAEVGVGSVNWVTTLHKNVSYLDMEKEIEVIRNQPLKLISIMDWTSKKLLDVSSIQNVKLVA